MSLFSILCVFFFCFCIYKFFFSLNDDKKPLCGARKRRWLVSVAWKKIPATAAIPTTKSKHFFFSLPSIQDKKKKEKYFFLLSVQFLLFFCCFVKFVVYVVCIWKMSKKFSFLFFFFRQTNTNSLILFFFGEGKKVEKRTPKSK